MNPINEVYFFGSNYKVAQIIDRQISIKHIICEKRLYAPEIYNFARLYSIEFKIVEAGKNLKLFLPIGPNSAVGISYGFGVVFKKEHIKAFKYGIWNIHPGELPNNRGRHPISWSFLKGDKKFGLSIHEINEKIDQGYLLAMGHVYREMNDTQFEVEDKMERLLESSLIKEAIDNYFSGRKRKLGKGVYNKHLIGRFKQICPRQYDSKFLFNLFKSQVKYGGVYVGKRRYIDCTFYNEEYPDLYKEYDIFVCKDGKKVGLK